MNIFEHAAVESRIESAENRVKHKHNELESKKVWGKKNYFPYESTKFLDMISLIRDEVKEKKWVVRKKLCQN